MTGLKTPRSARLQPQARAATTAGSWTGRVLDWTAVFAAVSALAMAASAGRAETPLPSISTVASAFADLGPAQPELLAESGAVDVTEVAPSEPELAAEAGTTRHIGQGSASYYGRELAGRRTANGEVFNPAELTAAHRTLPFGTRLRVTNQRNGRSVVVRINDRGPFARGRVLDLSHAAAERIGLVAAGHGPVSMELVEG